MATQKNMPEVGSVEKAPLPRPSFSSSRWATRPTRPRLVSLSWAGVRPTASQR